jgi:hypothetical protein
MVGGCSSSDEERKVELDDDDMLEQMEEAHWEFMRLKGGYSDEDIVKAKKRKQLSEDVNVCQLIIKSKAWKFGITHALSLL